MDDDQSLGFHVVGIGASAGGLEALEKFFSHVPENSGLAFVVVQHLSPDYKSLMGELLSKWTPLPIHVAQDGMELQPNHVYLIPRNKNLTVFHKKLFLAERDQDQLNLPIDIFLQSMAEDLGEKAIAIILSGTGSDGTRGIRFIKEEGGMVMAQDPKTAKFDGMPRSAISTQLVDYILPPEQMPREILNYVQHPCLTGDSSLRVVLSGDEDTLSKIFALLRSQSGVDFTYYKQTTMLRRIERRMGINQIKKISDYLHYLYENPIELNLLFKELLIGVTGFFRDPEAFDTIRHKVLPQIFEDKERGDQVRVWVAGCSTGEEAYSLAILLSDYMEKNAKFLDVKVFATDLDKDALEQAGKGIYPESIVADIPKEYFHNYFVRRGDSYEILRRVREMVIFAQQNIIDDPPFSKIDLISCRNVLIYLQPVLQKKVLAAFQFSLNSEGFLFLGTSETVGDMGDYFVSFDNKWKIYQYKGGSRAHLNGSILARSTGDYPSTRLAPYSRGRFSDGRQVGEDLYRYLIEMFLPPTVIIDEQRQLLHAFGDVDQFLQVPSGGRVSLDLLKMVREGLSIPLSTAIHKVVKDDKEDILYKNVALSEKQASSNEDETEVKWIDIFVKPLRDPGTKQRQILIQFRKAQTQEQISKHIETFDADVNALQRIADLEQELQFTRESLQATVEELETSNEELQATNEELLAANEELQSTNEELQSVNEELVTVNAEYQAKIQELMDLNADLNNLFSSTDVGTIFLDRFLRIRRFTPAVQHEIHLLEQDIGRPLAHISHNFVGVDLVHEAQSAAKSLSVREIEVQSIQKRWYLMKFHPYYTLDKRPDGVVISLVDITDLKASDEQAMVLSSALEQSPLLKLLIKIDGHIMYINPRVSEITSYLPKEVLGLPWDEFLLGKLKMKADEKNTHALITEIQNVFSNGGLWKGDLLYTNKQGQQFWGYSIFSTIYGKEGQPLCYLWMIEDITDRKKVEEQLQQSEAKYSKLFIEMTQGVVYQNQDGEIVSFNPAALEILGLSEDEILGRTSYDPRWQATHEDGTEFPGSEHPAMVALQSGKDVRDVVMGVFNPKDNQQHWIYVSSLPQFRAGEDRPYLVITTFTDVTTLFKAQKSLNALEKQLLAVLDTFEYPLLIVNEEGRIQVCNQKACSTLFGRRQDGNVDRCISCNQLMIELIPAEEREPFSQCLQQALQGEPSQLLLQSQGIPLLFKPLVPSQAGGVSSVLIMGQEQGNH